MKLPNQRLQFPFKILHKIGSIIPLFTFPFKKGKEGGINKASILYKKDLRITIMKIED